MDLEREIGILNYLMEQIGYIERYTSGYDEDAFLRNDIAKDAVLTRLMVLGEYSVRVDQGLRERFREVERQLLKAARNYYAHAYNGVDWIRVWEVIEIKIPELKMKLDNIIDTLENDIKE